MRFEASLDMRYVGQAFELPVPFTDALVSMTDVDRAFQTAYETRYAHTTADPKVIYTCNYFIFENPLNRIKAITDFRTAHDVPVWINQVGIEGCNDDAVAKQKARDVLGAFDDNGIGWAWWTYRLNGTNACTHGIYYLAPDAPDGWQVKKAWRTLVNGYLAA